MQIPTRSGFFEPGLVLGERTRRPWISEAGLGKRWAPKAAEGVWGAASSQ